MLSYIDSTNSYSISLLYEFNGIKFELSAFKENSSNICFILEYYFPVKIMNLGEVCAEYRRHSLRPSTKLNLDFISSKEKISESKKEIVKVLYDVYEELNEFNSIPYFPEHFEIQTNEFADIIIDKFNL